LRNSGSVCPWNNAAQYLDTGGNYMKIRCIKRTESGFTLVDVIMAIALLGVMASGIFGSFRYGFFTLQLTRENQRATQILLEKVETLRLYSWDQVLDPTFIPHNLPPEYYDPQGTSGSQGTVYNGTVTVTNYPLSASYAANMRQVTVTLTWSTGNIPHKRSLTTYIAKDGIQNYVY
jgi:type II secretory pathway pseudopilin PulG